MLLSLLISWILWLGFQQAPGYQYSNEELAFRDLGFIGQNYDLNVLSQATPTLTSGTLYAAGIFLQGGQTVSNVVFQMPTAAAGTAPTGMFVGICDANGKLLAASNNLAASAIWTGSSSYIVAPLSSPLVLPQAGFYYACLLQVGAFGTTQPTFRRGFNWGGQGPSLPNLLYAVLGAGLGTMPAVGTVLPFSAANALNFWAAVA